MSKKLPLRSMTSVRRACMMLPCDEQGKGRCHGAQESTRRLRPGALPRLQRSDHRCVDFTGWALRVSPQVLAADRVSHRAELTLPPRTYQRPSRHGLAITRCRLGARLDEQRHVPGMAVGAFAVECHRDAALPPVEHTLPVPAFLLTAGWAGHGRTDNAPDGYRKGKREPEHAPATRPERARPYEARQLVEDDQRPPLISPFSTMPR